MEVRVADRQRRLTVTSRALKKLATIALAEHEDGAGDYDLVGIALVTDAEMRTLNRAYRRLDRTTDVLSFDLRAVQSPGEPRSGEIVISTDRVVVQARRYRTTPERELARLLVHGVLHLCGHDHQRPAERARMRARERAALSAALAARVTPALIARRGVRPA
jgi:rRNA maturation RNase YbeY